MRHTAEPGFPALILAAALFAAGSVRADGECKAPAPVQHALEGGQHVPNCLAPAYSHYPPTSGPHFPVWADFRSFELVVSPGYYLHSEEHGAVVLLLNPKTPGDDKADFAKLKALADAYPQDPLCDAKTRHRIVVAGDTAMDARFAAVAWGWSLKSDCLDSAAFSAFMQDHYGQGPEDFCTNGTDFSGTGYCVEPMALGVIAPAVPPHTPLAPNRIWQGSLANRGTLRLEAFSMDGALLEAYDLGQAGPGPAQADWDPGAFRRAHPGTGAVALRLSLKKAGGVRLLSETLAFP
jgi:hypothetical protein